MAKNMDKKGDKLAHNDRYGMESLNYQDIDDTSHLKKEIQT